MDGKVGVIGLDSISARKKEADPSFWETLRGFHQELLKLEKSPDALKIRRLADARNLTLPTWFLGSVRASEKLSAKHPLGRRLIASTEAAEMASRREVARIRFSLLKSPINGPAFFPACGAGLDLLHFHDLHPKTPLIFSDIDVDHLRMANSNMKIAAGEGKGTPLCHDASRLPFKCTSGYTFIDPARRKGNEKFSVKNMEPSLSDSLALTGSTELFQIKLPAGFDPERHLPSSIDPAKWQWDWIQYGRDVVECVGTLQPSKSHSRGAHVIDSVSGQTDSWVTTSIGDSHQYEFRDISTDSIVLIPEASLKPSCLTQAWAKDHDLYPTSYPGIFISETPGSTPLGKRFKTHGKSRPSIRDITRQFSGSKKSRLEPLSEGDRFPRDLQKSIESHNRSIPKETVTLNILFLTLGKKKEVLILERI